MPSARAGARSSNPNRTFCRRATLEISQTHQCLETVKNKMRPERTMEMCERNLRMDISAVPLGRRNFYGTFPDTPCLANFRLCLRHEFCRRATLEISQTHQCLETTKNEMRPEGTMEFPIDNHHSNVSAVLSGRVFFCRDTRHFVSG